MVLMFNNLNIWYFIFSLVEILLVGGVFRYAEIEGRHLLLGTICLLYTPYSSHDVFVFRFRNSVHLRDTKV